MSRARSPFREARLLGESILFAAAAAAGPWWIVTRLARTWGTAGQYAALLAYAVLLAAACLAAARLRSRRYRRVMREYRQARSEWMSRGGL